MARDPHACWICGGRQLTLRKSADIVAAAPPDLAISDAHYGRTLAIYACSACGFLQCADAGDHVSGYTQLVDAPYEASRAERCLQARGLLRDIARLLGRDLRGARVLDVGAGSGPLVEEARAAGLDAEGVEPSTWLAARAFARGLPVHAGVLPHPAIAGPFDLVTLVDVIEHVIDPVALLRCAADLVVAGGTVVIVTPDVESVAARMLGWHWWHYRVAHVGYFSRSTIERLCRGVGLTPTAFARPGWVLPLPYLIERAGRYLPPLRLIPRAWGINVAVPFNLRDSWLVCARRPGSSLGT